MSELENFYNERKLETEKFILLLKKLDEIDEYTSDMPILKSQAILMMYNLIEGTVNKGLEYIFDTISNNNLKHHELNEHIRIIWMRYFKLHLDDGGQNRNRLIDFDIFMNDSVDIDIKKFRKINPNYFSGGSLDSKEIKKILKKFFIDLDSSEYKLKEIKDNRNFLAHGEKSFTEVSQSETVLDIEETQNKVFVFLEKYIEEIEKYICEAKYKKL